MRRYIPSAPSPVNIQLRGIPQGYPGIRATLGHVQALIHQGLMDFFVRQKAIDILLKEGIQPKDYLGEIRALFNFVQQNVRYTKDPYQVETLHTARRMLELRAGDCDDMTILLASLLGSIGHPVRLVIVGPDPSQPRHFSHIYLEAFCKGSWIPLDATMPFPMGWAPQREVKQVIPVRKGSLHISADLGAAPRPGKGRPGGWLPGLIQAIAKGTIPPRDARVLRLIKLLQKRQVWGQSRWLQNTLRLIYQRGQPLPPRPHTANRIARVLQRFNLLPVHRPELPAQGGQSTPSPFSTSNLQARPRQLLRGTIRGSASSRARLQAAGEGGFG